MSIFSQRLFQARNSSGLTQTEIAEKIPMTQPSYSRIENGFQEPNLNQLRRIAEVLDISLDFLLNANTEYYNNQRNSEIAAKIFELYKTYFSEAEKTNENENADIIEQEENDEK